MRVTNYPTILLQKGVILIVIGLSVLSMLVSPFLPPGTEEMWALLTFCAMFALPIYLLPSFIASFRQQKQTGTIVTINVLLGWTLLGWMVAMALALWDFTPEEKP